MEKHDNPKQHALDIEEKDLFTSDSERDLKNAVDNGEIDPDENPNNEAIKAGIRYGRDSYMVKSDIDAEEDDYVPGLKEQD